MLNKEQEEDSSFSGSLASLRNQLDWFANEQDDCREAEVLTKGLLSFLEELIAKKTTREVGTDPAPPPPLRKTAGTNTSPQKTRRHRGTQTPKEGVVATSRGWRVTGGLGPSAADMRRVRPALGPIADSLRRSRRVGGTEGVPEACARGPGLDRPPSIGARRAPVLPGIVVRSPRVGEIRMNETITGNLVVEIPDDAREEPAAPARGLLVGSSPGGSPSPPLAESLGRRRRRYRCVGRPSAVLPGEGSARCYRCLGVGHVAMTCWGEQRGGRCYRCGAHTHKKCTAGTPRCPLGPTDLGVPAGHILGGQGCVSFSPEKKGGRREASRVRAGGSRRQNGGG